MDIITDIGLFLAPAWDVLGIMLYGFVVIALVLWLGALCLSAVWSFLRGLYRIATWEPPEIPKPECPHVVCHYASGRPRPGVVQEFRSLPTGSLKMHNGFCMFGYYPPSMNTPCTCPVIQ